jgi:hypothetical protein
MLFPKTSSWKKGVHFQDVDKWCQEWSEPCHTNGTNMGFAERLDHVVTLTLGLRSKQGLARLRANREARESHFMLPKMQKSVRE